MGSRSATHLPEASARHGVAEASRAATAAAAPRRAGFLVFAALCTGQLPLTAQDEPVFTSGGTGNAQVQTMQPFQNALVFGANKSAWQLVWQEVASTDRRLSLFKSDDGGNTWPAVPTLELPTLLSGRGSIAMGADCKTLSVLWDARDPDPLYSSVHYGELDTDTGLWSCNPTVLAIGTSSSNFWAMDVESTLGGRIAAIYMRSYVGTQNPWFKGNWSSTIRVKQPGPCTFGAGQAINTGNFAVFANMVAIGDDVHIVYRTGYGGYGISYRGFDTRTASFFTSTSADVPIGPNFNLDMRASNVAIIATNNRWARECDLACLHVVYATGDSQVGNGYIWHAWADVATADSNGGWSQNPIVAYPELQGGNYNYHHYSLATGENGAVHAIWKRKASGVTEVWSQGFGCGAALAPAQLFSSTQDLPGINGHRGSHTTAKPHLMISRQGLLEGVWMWRERGLPPVWGRARTVAYGRSCELEGMQPTLRSRNTPTIGDPPLVLEVSGLANSQPALLMAGTVCTSIQIGSSCWILQDITPIVLSLGSIAGCGQTTTSIVVPNSSSLVDACVYLQALQLAPNINLGSPFIVTNGLMAILDK